MLAEAPQWLVRTPGTSRPPLTLSTNGHEVQDRTGANPAGRAELALGSTRTGSGLPPGRLSEGGAGRTGWGGRLHRHCLADPPEALGTFAQVGRAGRGVISTLFEGQLVPAVTILLTSRDPQGQLGGKRQGDPRPVCESVFKGHLAAVHTVSGKCPRAPFVPLKA